MIVPMKRIFLITQAKDAKDSFEQLQALGAVHVEHQEDLKGDRVFEVCDGLETLNQVIDILQSVDYDMEQETAKDWREKANEVLDLKSFITQYQEFVDKRTLRIKYWEAWGNFEPQDIRDLAQKGVFVHFYEIPTNITPEVPKDVALECIASSDGMNRYMAVMRNDQDLPYDRVMPPPVSLENLKKLQAEEKNMITESKRLIEESRMYLNQFIALRDEGLDTLALEEAVIGAQKEDQLVVLRGFAPEDRVADIEAYAKHQKVGLYVSDPSDEEQVPTLLKNPKWVELSKPALNMIEILPGYKELDVSLVFIVFFTLFFGMLIGDAAYGAIFGLLTLVIQLKRKDKDKTPYNMMYLLTGFTILWGVLTGTYFGQQWLPSPVKPVVPWLTDANNVQWLCFTIAVVHLSIARFWTFMVKLPSITAIAEIGWLLIVWGMYFLANMFVLGQAMPSFAGYFFMAGIPLALLFMFPPKKLLKNIGQEIIPFVLGVIGAGTDIISYIRLFAVGLATVAVADAANAMPAALPGVGGYSFMVLLHLLNMVLAGMAILVHAIRLNVLEFSGHLGLEWAGFKYSPLSKRLKTT